MRINRVKMIPVILSCCQAPHANAEVDVTDVRGRYSYSLGH